MLQLFFMFPEPMEPFHVWQSVNRLVEAQHPAALRRHCGALFRMYSIASPSYLAFVIFTPATKAKDKSML
jgi:hypothetical protein